MSQADTNAISGYIDSLKAALEAARKTGAGADAWLLSDRLLRMSEHRDAAACLRRAEAAALIGDVDAARQDALAAFWIDPSIPMLAASLVPSLAPGAARRAALRHALALGAPPDEPLLAALAAEGFQSVVIARRSGEAISGEIIAESPVAPQLLANGAATPLVLVEQPRAEGARWPFRATFSQAWPAGAPWVSVALEGALVLPGALVAAQPTMPPSAETVEGGVLVVVPAYADWPSLERCLKSVISQTDETTHLIVVEDASPDESLREALTTLARSTPFTVLHNPVNLGFSGAVNRGLSLRRTGEAALVLNADATLPQGAIARLRQLAASAPDIGTLTPLSNNGEDTAVPQRFRVNPEPDDAWLAHLDACAQAANRDTLIPLPNGVGFCLFITAPALDAVGGFSGAFERGYFEDVDLSLRIAEAGFRNLAATGVYVAHAGARSFGTAKEGYVRLNKPQLHARHPCYETQVQALLAQDPLAPATNALMREYLRRTPFEKVLIAPADCPAAYALGQSAGAGRTLLLRPSGAGWRAQASTDPFPVDLGIDEPALTLAMPWLEAAPISVLDAARLPPSHQAVLPKGTRGLSTEPAAQQATTPPPGARIGIAWPELGQADEAALSRMIAELRPAVAVMIDRMSLETEARFFQALKLQSAGEITAQDLAGVARRAGLSALVFAHPVYRALDPRREAAQAAGLRVVDPA